MLLLYEVLAEWYALLRSRFKQVRIVSDQVEMCACMLMILKRNNCTGLSCA
jgi:hypothetical protein